MYAEHMCYMNALYRTIFTSGTVVRCETISICYGPSATGMLDEIPNN